MHSRAARPHKHPVRALMFLTNPTVILLAVLLVLFSWRLPTRVRIDLFVEPSEYPGERPDAATLLDALRQQPGLVAEGILRYPDFPEIEPVHFSAPASLEFDGKELQGRWLESPSDTRWHLQVEGIAARLRLQTPEQVSDVRLTQFDHVKASPRLVWTGLGVWLAATILGWMRVYQELRK